MKKIKVLPFLLMFCFIAGVPSLLSSQQKFYEYYEKGLNYASSQDWQAAVEMFKKAVEIDSEESYRKRVYGTKFIEYFPLRELGIAYAYMKQDELARQYIAKSLADVYSERAEEYKNKIGDPTLFTAAPPKNNLQEKSVVKSGVITAPPLLTVRDFIFSEPSGNNVLDMGEKGAISFVIENKGKGDAFDIEAEVECKEKNLTFRSADVGDIRVDEFKQVKIEVIAGRKVNTAEVQCTVKINEKNGFNAADVNFSFSTLGFQPPLLEVVNTGISEDGTGESQGNGNQQIEHSEVVQVKTFVQNKGSGTAESVKAEIKITDSNIFLLSGDKFFNLGDIEPGDYRPVTFTFTVNKKFSGKKLPITLKISEATGDYGKSADLALEMNQITIASKDIVISPTLDKKEVVLKDIPSAIIDIDESIPVTRHENKDAIAVIIGNKDYLKTKSVDFAINDARSIKNYLMKSLGYKEGNIFLVENATQTDFRTFFGVAGNHKGKLFNTVKKNISDVFIFYAGHGAPGLNDKNGYFVPVECDPQYVELGGYPLEVFYSNLSKVPAKSFTILLDACFSGATIFENISPIVIQMKNPVMSLQNGVVITSSSGSQVSSWYNEKKHGMFTYFLLKGVHNRNADTDKNGKLTFQELFNFISDESEGVPYYARRIHGVEQNPTIQGKQTNRTFVNY